MPKILKAEGIETDSIGSNGNNYFDLQRNRSTLVRLSTSDLVGIGTTTPAYKFTIQTSSGTSAQIGILSESQTIDNGSEMTMDLRNASGFFSGGSIRVRHTVGSQTAGNESTYMSFLTRGSGSLSERMRIDSSGNVGIGTNNPLSRLHIDGNLTFSNATIATSATAGANGDVPAQVAGYLVISINGTSRKIPYYAT